MGIRVNDGWRLVKKDGHVNTCVGIVCEAKALGASRLGVVHKAEALDLASAAKQLRDLLLGQAIGDVSHEDDAGRRSSRHVGGEREDSSWADVVTSFDHCGRMRVVARGAGMAGMWFVDRLRREDS